MTGDEAALTDGVEGDGFDYDVSGWTTRGGGEGVDKADGGEMDWSFDSAEGAIICIFIAEGSGGYDVDL